MQDPFKKNTITIILVNILYIGLAGLSSNLNMVGVPAEFHLWVGLPIVLALMLGVIHISSSWWNDEGGNPWNVAIPILIVIFGGYQLTKMISEKYYHIGFLLPLLGFSLIVFIYNYYRSRKNPTYKIPLFGVSPIFFFLFLVPASSIFSFWGLNNFFVTENHSLWLVAFWASILSVIVATAFSRQENLFAEPKIPKARISFWILLIVISIFYLAVNKHHGGNDNWHIVYSIWILVFLPFLSFIHKQLIYAIDLRGIRVISFSMGTIISNIYIIIWLLSGKNTYEFVNIVTIGSTIFTGILLPWIISEWLESNRNKTRLGIIASHLLVHILLLIFNPIRTVWSENNSDGFLFLEFLLLFLSAGIISIPYFLKKYMPIKNSYIYSGTGLVALFTLLGVSWYGSRGPIVDLDNYAPMIEDWDLNKMMKSSLDIRYSGSAELKKGGRLDGLLPWPGPATLTLHQNRNNFTENHLSLYKCSGKGKLKSFFIRYQKWNHPLIAHSAPRALVNGKVVPEYFDAKNIMRWSEKLESPVYTYNLSDNPLDNGTFRLRMKRFPNMYYVFHFGKNGILHSVGVEDQSESCASPSKAILVENMVFKKDIFQNAKPFSDNTLFTGNQSNVGFYDSPNGKLLGKSLLKKGEVVKPWYVWNKDKDEWYLLKSGWVPKKDLIEIEKAGKNQISNILDNFGYFQEIHNTNRNRCNKDFHKNRLKTDPKEFRDVLVNLNLTLNEKGGIISNLQNYTDNHLENISFSNTFSKWNQIDLESGSNQDLKYEYELWKSCSTREEVSQNASNPFEFSGIARMQSSMECHLHEEHDHGEESDHVNDPKTTVWFINRVDVEFIKATSLSTRFDQENTFRTSHKEDNYTTLNYRIKTSCNKDKIQEDCKQQDLRLPNLEEAKYLQTKLTGNIASKSNSLFYRDKDKIKILKSSDTGNSKNKSAVLACVTNDFKITESTQPDEKTKEEDDSFF